MKFLFLIFFTIYSHFVFSQILISIISDTLNNPLENSNVIAKPLQEKASLKFDLPLTKNDIS